MNMHMKGHTALKLAGVLGVAMATLGVTALPARAAAEVKLASHLEQLSFSGDIRMRHEDFDKKTSGQVDRKRQRFRLRLNADMTLPKNFKVRTTFASGTGEQVSTNQSFDNLSGQKEMWIDKVYVQWMPLEGLDLRMGRMANPIWTQYSSDVVWDGDFNPEGFSQSYSRLVGPVNVFVSALQMVVDEDFGNNVGVSTKGAQADQWMLGQQIGFETKLPAEMRLKLAFANYYWRHARRGAFSQVATNEGNRRSGTTLTNRFNVNEFTGNIGAWVFELPLQLQGTYVKNTSARDDSAYLAGQPKEDTGFQIGAILGKAGSKDKSWEIAYFRKHVRTDATVADVADSDFGDGGTNREGKVMWIAYAPYTWMTFQLKHFQTKVINVALSPGRDDINRTQLDWSLKF